MFNWLKRLISKCPNCGKRFIQGYCSERCRRIKELHEESNRLWIFWSGGAPPYDPKTGRYLSEAKNWQRFEKRFEEIRLELAELYKTPINGQMSNA